MRREFITLLGGAAVLYPLTLVAQPSPAARITIIGVLAPPSFTASEGLREGYHELGYVEGQHCSGVCAGRKARLGNLPTASLSWCDSAGRDHHICTPAALAARRTTPLFQCDRRHWQSHRSGAAKPRPSRQKYYRLHLHRQQPRSEQLGVPRRCSPPLTRGFAVESGRSAVGRRRRCAPGG